MFKSCKIKYSTIYRLHVSLLHFTWMTQILVLSGVQQTHKLSSVLGIRDCCQAATLGEVILFCIEN